MNGNWPSTATRLLVFGSRDDEWRLRLSMVNDAQRFLLLTTYYFGSDEQSGQMLDALAAAAQRKVRVVLVLDRFGHRLAENLSLPGERARLAERLRAFEAAGGQLVSFTPKSLRHRFVGGGMHVKIQVSESGTAVFGSSNLAHHSFFQWNEVSLQVQGALVTHLLHDACQLAGLDADETAAFTRLLPTPHDSDPTCDLRYVREDPAERAGPLFPFGIVRNRLTDDLVRLIDGAKHSICIASLYCKPAPVLRRAILRACRRGVMVEIFHSHRDSLGVTHIPWLSASINYRKLLKAGARIYENRAGEHSKVILVDDQKVAVGSYNLEHAADDRLIEAMIFSEDTTFCGQFRRLFQTLRLAPDNRVLTAGWLGELPLHLQIKHWLCRPLQRWM